MLRAGIYGTDYEEVHEVSLPTGCLILGVYGVLDTGEVLFPMATDPLRLESGNYEFRFDLRRMGDVQAAISLPELRHGATAFLETYSGRPVPVATRESRKLTHFLTVPVDGQVQFSGPVGSYYLRVTSESMKFDVRVPVTIQPGITESLTINPARDTKE